MSARLPWFQGLEEIITLVINEDECGEVLDLNLPYSLHAQLGILHALDAPDAALGEDSGHAADGAEVETSVLEAGVGDDLRAVALGDHDEGGAVVLELIHVGIHAVGRGGAHGAAGVSGGRLGRAGQNARRLPLRLHGPHHGQPHGPVCG